MSLRKWLVDELPEPKDDKKAENVVPSEYIPASTSGVHGEVIPFDGFSSPTDTNIFSLGDKVRYRSPKEDGSVEYTKKGAEKYFKPARGPRASFFDPLTLLHATGYRHRRFSLTYDVLRRVANQLTLIGSIVLTRVNQVASFSEPYRDTGQMGFEVRFKDKTYNPSEAERNYLREVESFLKDCGWKDNKYCDEPRDDFELFLKKVVRDSLTMDQMCFEVVPDTKGLPFEFRPVDAATIRLAGTYDGKDKGGPVRFDAGEFSPAWREAFGDDFVIDGERIYTVQVVHGRIENIFSYHDMAFCIRNGRTDLYVNNYGLAEIEICLHAVTRMLWAEEYNGNNFKQGSLAGGIINLKGDTYAPEQMEALKRMWLSRVAGYENAHKTPILQIPEGVEFVNLQRGNREMEYRAWLEYLMKIISGIFEIDPAEINFDLVSGAGGRGGPMFESKHEWKIKYSKDRGLRPILKFVAKAINKYIINPLDPRLYFDFVGLDQETESDRIEIDQRKSSSIYTVNEVRQSRGLPPVVAGDTILNPAYLQAVQSEIQMSQMGKKGIRSPVNPLSPWLTFEDVRELDYGFAPPVPLVLQEGPHGQQGADIVSYEQAEIAAGVVPGEVSLSGGAPPVAGGAPTMPPSGGESQG